MRKWRQYSLGLWLLALALGAQAATYYVRSSGGNDGANGTSFATGWATLGKAASTATAAGDVVYICADGTHTPAATVAPAGIGTSALPIIWRGASATGADDGTLATISGASLPATNDLFSFGGDSQVAVLQGLRLTAAKRYGVVMSSMAEITLIKCRVDNAATAGLYSSMYGQLVRLIECEIDHNAAGTGNSAANRGVWTLIRCSVHHNTGVGVAGSMTSGAGQGINRFEDCLFYRNGTDGINLYASGSYGKVAISRCVFFANGGDGIDINSSGGSVCIDSCLFKGNGNYNIRTNTGTVAMFIDFRNCCAGSSTSGHIDINSGSFPGSGHVYSDPLFTTEADGSENFALQATSPAKALGLPGAMPVGGTGYRDAGPLQHQDTGTGGTTTNVIVIED